MNLYIKNLISINYNQPTQTIQKETLNSIDLRSILEEEGICDKIMVFKSTSSSQQKKFWPEEIKSTSSNNEYLRSQTQQILITECIKNKENWAIKSISREIEETAISNVSNHDKKNETESKKSSIYYSEKIDEELQENEEDKSAHENNTAEKKSSFHSKSQRSQKGNTAKNANASATLNDNSILSENTEKV